MCARSRKVLIYRPGGGMGDALVALPTIHRIRRDHPYDELWFLGIRGNKQKRTLSSTVISAFERVTGIVEYPIEDLKSPGKIIQMGLGLRRMRFDVLYYLEGQGTSWIRRVRDLFFFRVIAGIGAICVPMSPKQTSKRWSIPVEMSINEAVRLYSTVNKNTNDFPIADIKIDVSDSAREVCRDKVCQILPDARHNGYIVSCVTTQMPVNQWGIDRYIEVFKRMYERFKVPVIIIGSMDEKEILLSVVKRLPHGSATLSSEITTELPELAALVSEAICYVGNDTGPMHLAWLVGVPCVVVYSARNIPGSWHPLGGGHRILRVSVPCQGCGKISCETPRCISSITIEEVESNVTEVIFKTGGRR